MPLRSLCPSEQFPTSGAHQERLQRGAILGVQGSKFAAKLLQAFHLIFERRKRVRQVPDLYFNPLEAVGKGLCVGDQKRQIKLTCDKQERLDPPAECAFARMPFAIDT